MYFLSETPLVTFFIANVARKNNLIINKIK